MKVYIYYREKPTFLHYYSLLVILFPLTLLTRFKMELSVCILFLIGLLKLSTVWSYQSLIIQCYQKTNFDQSTHILYNDRLCLIERSSGEKKHHFIYKNQLFLIHAADDIEMFVPTVSYRFSDYKNFSRKIRHPDYSLYRDNCLEFPEATFLTVLKEQCTTPMFCFQIFTSILQIFDDYFYGPIFGIISTISGEVMMTINRMYTKKMFGELEGKKEQKIEVMYRGKDYSKRIAKKVSERSLRTGDIVCITTPILVPCDILILEGPPCVVNESMLSGESVPIVKESIGEDSNEEIFDMAKHKQHMLFSGTEIEKIQDGRKVIGYVLMTGFDSEKGRLINTMLQAEEISYDKEALRFVLILTLIGMTGSLFVLCFSRKSGYSLFLDLVILFTNSIPVELPLEMGMSLQAAVKSLTYKNIFCLEPFRILIAGKVEVCCFDKTGTLTASTMAMKDVAHESPEGPPLKKLLSTCHSIFMLDNRLRGDSIDLAIAGYFMLSKELFVHKIYKNLQFCSERKRQTVVAQIGNQIVVVMKGAPEEVQKYLHVVPSCYSDYMKFAAKGYRVIAVAYKEVDSEEFSTSSAMEENLIFKGFLLFGTSLRKYAKRMSKVLRETNHRIVMITGDNPLTASNVARQLGIVPRTVSAKKIDDSLEKLSDHEFLSINIFARASPLHKEKIIKKYSSMNKKVMMVGDGTNDVGALKAADVGIAILDKNKNSTLKNQNSTAKDNLEVDDFCSVKIGDASVAAPITVKTDTLKSVLEIIQQGRSSAISIIQMYKIIALNSLINVFTNGFLDLFGVKFGEKQCFALQILNVAAFHAISKGEALTVISKERVVVSIFSKYIILSIIIQTAVQSFLFFALVYFLRDSESVTNYFAGINMSDSKFSPSLLNSSVFILGIFHTISIFACNYIGRPFRENITENNILFLSLAAFVGIGTLAIFEVFPFFNSYLELVSLGEFKFIIFILCISMVISTFAIEKLCCKLFIVASEDCSTERNRKIKTVNKIE